MEWEACTPCVDTAQHQVQTALGALTSHPSTLVLHRLVTVVMKYGLGDYTSGWTRFTLDWTQDWITIHVNNTLVASYTENITITRSFTDAQPLIFTSTIMDRTPTLPQDKFPQEFLIDWVRVYAWDD
eukprot:m.156278 g.156278  ORF g.156278 m.156278 type:complete len:127 (-) comp30983_c0_seq1:87-467(-)